MLSLIASVFGFLSSGLPKVLEFFQDRADKAHELKLASMQTERELALAAQGFAAQAKIEEIRTEQVALQTDAERQGAALDHDKAIMARADSWVVNLNGIVRPIVTFIFVLELVLINLLTMLWIFLHGDKVTSIGELIQIMEIVFDADEMALLGTIIAMWFGSRGNSKAGK